MCSINLYSGHGLLHNEGMWIYCGHFQLHKQFWLFDWIENFMILLAIANLKYSYFKVCELELHAQGIR